MQQLCWNDLLQATGMVSKGLEISAIIRELLKPWFILVISLSLREVCKGSCPGGMHWFIKKQETAAAEYFGKQKHSYKFFPDGFTFPRYIGTGRSQNHLYKRPLIWENHA